MGYRLYTVHERGVPVGADPDVVLVREGFAWGAAIFGPLWFLVHRLWLAALVDLVLIGIVGELLALIDPSDPIEAAASLGLALLTGWLAPEAWRWTLARRGYGLTRIVGGRNRDAAERRLFASLPPDHRAAFSPAARMSPV